MPKHHPYIKRSALSRSLPDLGLIAPRLAISVNVREVLTAHIRHA